MARRAKNHPPSPPPPPLAEKEKAFLIIPFDFGRPGGGQAGREGSLKSFPGPPRSFPRAPAQGAPPGPPPKAPPRGPPKRAPKDRSQGRAKRFTEPSPFRFLHDGKQALRARRIETRQQMFRFANYFQSARFGLIAVYVKRLRAALKTILGF